MANLDFDFEFWWWFKIGGQPLIAELVSLFTHLMGEVGWWRDRNLAGAVTRRGVGLWLDDKEGV